MTDDVGIRDSPLISSLRPHGLLPCCGVVPRELCRLLHIWRLAEASSPTSPAVEQLDSSEHLLKYQAIHIFACNMPPVATSAGGAGGQSTFDKSRHPLAREHSHTQELIPSQ